jgi:hypothetical protein
MANNSISQIIRQFLEMNQNSLETYEKISEAITTDKKTVTVDMFDAQGVLKTVQVPAFGYLKREIERLDTNFKSLSGLGVGNSAVKMADGTFRRINKSKLKTPAKNVTSIEAPKEFVSKTNNFFESFLNPLLQIELNVNGQVDANTEKIKIKRYLVDSTDDNSIEWFNDNVNGLDNLNIDLLVSNLETNAVKYIIDEEIIDTPVRSNQYYGGFNVTKVRTTQRSIIVSGVTELKTIKLYTVDKLSYNNASKDMSETESLRIGDELLVNSGNNSTKYKIISINSDTLELELLLIEGFDSITIGLDVIKIYKNKEAYDSINISVGFDERMVIFIKPVDPESNLEAEQWSPGTGFYSSSLLITRENGEVQTLADYYKEEVADFGQMIKSLKDDYIPPVTVGVIPDAPVLSTDIFKVVQVNTHLTKGNSFEKVKDLSANKVNIEENVKGLDSEISIKRSLVATKNYTSTISKDRDKNELQSLINQRASESKLYASLVNEIRSVADNSSITTTTPKFRVRGFWSMPIAKLAGNTIPQEVVQFKIQYRYLSPDGTPSDVNQIQVNEAGKQKTGVFTNWVEIFSKARNRIKNEITGKYLWEIESIEDGQSININQLDIAIQPGEIVEVRVKSISEAGWPTNPVESEWSSTTQITFPSDILVDSSVVNLIKENSNEVAKVNMIDELNARGVYQHISDAFTINEKYFAHDALSIASGFLTTEQSPITLFQKLTQMQTEINALKEQIAKTVGELSIKLQYPDGSTEIIQNNTTKSIFAGYYTDEVANLQIKKGHVVTKTYKIILENSKATPLELISRLAGNRKTTAPASTIATNNPGNFGPNVPPVTIPLEVINDAYYLTSGKYDLVPTLYQNTSAPEFATSIFLNDSPYQSAHLKGQFVYSRFKDIANNTTALYALENLDTSASATRGALAIPYEYGAESAPAGTSPGYIFTSYSGVNPQGTNITTASVYDNSIFLHIDHPFLLTTSSVGDVYDNGNRFVQSKAAKVNNIQMGYYYSTTASRSIKMAFEPNDQYLLGGMSCGSYLFTSPLSIDALSTNADNTSGKKTIITGAGNEIAIDVIFQYRMTDYAGTSDAGLGFLAGEYSQTKTNLTYSKRIGIDVIDVDNNKFAFDLEVFAKYKA